LEIGPEHEKTFLTKDTLQKSMLQKIVINKLVKIYRKGKLITPTNSTKKITE